MVNHINYQSIFMVIESWELARQKYGCEEEVGTAILLNLFRAAPGAKAVFGFKPNENIEDHPRRRIAMLVHGAQIVQMMDGVLMLLGPDVELLEKILGKLGRRHERHGVKKEYFPLLGDAIRETLASINGDNFTDEADAAWKEVFGELSAEIVKSMA